jgi:hypothetical protein
MQTWSPPYVAQVRFLVDFLTDSGQFEALLPCRGRACPGRPDYSYSVLQGSGSPGTSPATTPVRSTRSKSALLLPQQGGASAFLGDSHIAPHRGVADHPRILLAGLASCERRQLTFDPSRLVRDDKRSHMCVFIALPPGGDCSELTSLTLMCHPARPRSRAGRGWAELLRTLMGARQRSPSWHSLPLNPSRTARERNRYRCQGRK